MHADCCMFFLDREGALTLFTAKDLLRRLLQYLICVWFEDFELFLFGLDINGEVNKSVHRQIF